MKRKFTFLTAALALLAFLAFPMGMRGQTNSEVTYTFSDHFSSNSTELSDLSFDDAITASFAKGGGSTAPQYYTNGTAVRWYGGNTLTITATNATMSQIELTYTQKNKVVTVDVGTYDHNTAVWTGSTSSVTFTVESGSGHNRVSAIKVTYAASGGTPTPTITAENVEIAYNATSGAIEYTINNPVTDGNLTASTTAEWLTIGTVGTTVPFICSANSAPAARTATVTLTYTYNTDQTVTKNVTVTQDANPDVVNNISDITATGTYTVQGTIVAKSTRGFIVGDGTGYVYYYNSNYTQADYNIGDMVKLAGSVSVFGGVYEFTNSATITTATSSNYVAEDPTVLTGADMDARVASTTPPQLSNYVQYEGTLTVDGTHYNITSITGASTAIGSISYPISTDFTSLNGKHVKVTGYYVGISTSTYYNTMLGSIEEVANNDPMIAAEDVSIEYDATSGAIAYTIDNPVDGGALTAATESEWLTLGTVGTTVPFTCQANTTTAARTATVTLTYTYNADQFVTKNVTVTQAGNPNVVDNISDITVAGTYTVQGTIVAINNRGFIVGDGTGYVYYYYGSSGFEPGDYDIGDNVKLSGDVVVYGGVFEFNNATTITYVEESNYMEEEPTVLTGADMDARVASTTPVQLSSYVQYEGTLNVSGNYYNITNIAGAQTAKGSISFPLDTEFASLNGQRVKVTGYYVGVSSSQYYNTMIGSVEEVVSTEPSITVTPATVNVDAEAHLVNYLDLAYENIVVENYQSFTVHYYNAANEEIQLVQGESWMIASVVQPNDVYQVVYTVMANEGEARTAYFKVSALDAENNVVYSNLVTINQEAYVAPTFAELPFAFDDGKAAIDTIDGLSQEGLDSDYGSSPKLKFNTTGDWLLLQFNEVPGALTFDIKGNGFSGGTFTVQTSEDGVTYTDLETYTELGATQSELFDNLGENVRYIKWIYTEKVSGNVALGNIYLYEEGGGPVIPTYDLTVNPFENLEIFTFVGGNENEAALDGAGTIQLAEGVQVMLSVTANEGYVLQSLMVDGVEHVNDITEEETYTFTMPGHNVTISATAVEVTPSTTDEYVLYTGELVEGDYIIYYNGKAMNNVVSNDRLQYAEIEPEDDVITTDNATIVWHIAPNDEGYWTIFSADANAYAASTGVKNKAQMLEDGTDDKAMWSDSLTENGTYEFINKYNANANVNAYLRNNSTYGFACYATTTGGALSLYKKVEQTTITQTTALVGGEYNRVSIYVVVEDPVAMLEALKAQLGEGTTIESADYGTENYGDGDWFGDLDDIGVNNQEMYLILTPEDCSFELQGMPADPAEYQITLLSETWNRIGFPYSEAVSVVDALAGYEAEVGDIIEGPNGQVEYYGDGDWFGDFEEFVPGEGYMYYSAKAEDDTLVFSTGAKKTRNAKPVFKNAAVAKKAVLNVIDIEPKK